MSEPFVRSRPDAGGFDQPGRRVVGSYNREDPLAELARLVGKDDPFRTAATPAPASNVATFPQAAQPVRPVQDPAPISAEDDGIGDFHEPGYPDFDAQLRGSLDGRMAEGSVPRDSLRFPAIDEAEPLYEPSLDGAPHAQRSLAPPLNADLWAEGARAQEGEPASYETPLSGGDADDRSAKRTGMVLAAVLVLVGGGIGATFLMRGGSGSVGSSGAPPTIMASDTPVKVQSPDVANGGNPDSNTALLEKKNSDKVDNAKVMTNNEQPVDLNQLPKAGAAQPEAGQASSSTSPNAFPEPRKVKTVLIRPDGSVVGEAAPQPAPQPPIGMVMPTGADGSATTPPVASDAPVAKPSTPKSTARVSSTPKDATAGGGASGAKQAAAPAHTPKPKPVAVAEAAPADEAPAAAPGTWSVQVGAPPSEQEAKDMAGRLQKKFADQLGGSKLSVRKADNKSVYRVRVGNLSQDDAKALCGKLQAGGGSCFVVRN